MKPETLDAWANCRGECDICILHGPAGYDGCPALASLDERRPS